MLLQRFWMLQTCLPFDASDRTPFARASAFSPPFYLFVYGSQNKNMGFGRAKGREQGSPGSAQVPLFQFPKVENGMQYLAKRIPGFEIPLHAPGPNTSERNIVACTQRVGWKSEALPSPAISELTLSPSAFGSGENISNYASKSWESEATDKTNLKKQTYA